MLNCFFCFVILEETARLLTDLATIETMKGMAITASTALNKEHDQVKYKDTELSVQPVCNYASEKS